MANLGVYEMVDTWNEGSTEFTSLKMDVTDMASLATSKLMDLLVGGSSKFTIDKNGTIKGAAGLVMPGYIAPALITGNQNDYAPTGHATAIGFRLTSDAPRTITGLAGGVAGRIVWVGNTGSNPITLANNSGSSTAANRFALNTDVLLLANEAVILAYDATSLLWRMIASYTNPIVDWSFAVTNETDALTTGTGRFYFRFPYNVTLTHAPKAMLKTASSSGLVVADINKNGTSILGTNKLSIEASEKTSGTAATPVDFTAPVTFTADTDELSIDIDSHGTGAVGLKVSLIGRRG